MNRDDLVAFISNVGTLAVFGGLVLLFMGYSGEGVAFVVAGILLAGAAYLYRRR